MSFFKGVVFLILKTISLSSFGSEGEGRREARQREPPRVARRGDPERGIMPLCPRPEEGPCTLASEKKRVLTCLTLMLRCSCADPEADAFSSFSAMSVCACVRV